MPFIQEPLKEEILKAAGIETVFLSGPFGIGKTTLALEWLRKLITIGVSAEEILILTPQRTLGAPFKKASQENIVFPAGVPVTTTIHGLSRRLISVFWPLICDSTFFPRPSSRPVFLTIESILYHMKVALTPYLEKGYFSDLHIEKNRLFSQILDNLNKSAFVRIPLDEVFNRLSTSWCGDPARLSTYKQAHEAAQTFRDYCLNHSLIDASLQMEIFSQLLWKNDLVREYLHKHYQHIIFDNIEEDIPVCHDILLEWMVDLKSALIIFDEGGGYRTFLGADPASALRLQAKCNVQVSLKSLSEEKSSIECLKQILSSCIKKEPIQNRSKVFIDSFVVQENRFITDMVFSLAERINYFISNDIKAEDIVIIGAYISDALLFSITQALQKYAIKTISTRPSRSLINEPAVRALIAFANIVFNQSTGNHLTSQEIRIALQVGIKDLDIIRADLISKMLFDRNNPSNGFRPFSSISNPEMRSRISYLVGEKIDLIQAWLINYRDSGEQTLDTFFSRIFGELLSQPGFGMHDNLEYARATAQLIRVTKSLRIECSFLNSNFHLSPSDSLQAIESGIFSGALPNEHLPDDLNAVLVSPAHSFLMQNRSVKIQFWIDIGSLGWWERLNQPLTQPYVLKRGWNPTKQWTDEEEFNNNQLNMTRLISGLLDRCTERVYVETVHYNEQGFEPRGPLLFAVQQYLKHIKGKNPIDV